MAEFGKTENTYPYERRRWPRASSLIGIKTLMLFVQPQRLQGTKIKIHIIPLWLCGLVPWWQICNFDAWIEVPGRGSSLKTGV